MRATFLTRRLLPALGALTVVGAMLAATPATAAADPAGPTPPGVTAGTNGLVAWVQYYYNSSTLVTTSSLSANNGRSYFHPVDSLNTRPDDPDFSPDGSRLTYTVYGGASAATGIWVVSNPFAHWSNLVRLTDSQYDSDPTWSPDGKQIAFIRSQSGDNGIWVMDADGGAPQQLFKDPNFWGYDLAWSPDGTKIAYANYSGSPFSSPLHVYVLDIDAGTTTDLGAGLSPSWSPNGFKIAFQVQFSSSDGDIWWMNPDGSARSALNSSGINNWDPSWSPDSTKVVYVAPAGISYIDVNTFAQGSLGSGSNLGSPVWAPAPSMCQGRAATVSGTPGDDILRGSRGVDVINGLAGNDTIFGMQGQDVICGGPGSDTVSYAGQTAPVTAYVGETAPSSGVSDLISTDVEKLTGGDGPDHLSGPGELRGGPGADVLTTTGLAVTLYGGGGDDRLVGGAGGDALNGEGGDDLLIGNEGGDFLYGDPGDDVLRGGDGADTMEGAAGDDELYGGADNDGLDGGLDSDLIVGGPGVDTADYSARTIWVNVTLGAGGDDDGSRQDGTVGERDRVRGSVENVVGGSGGDLLVGSEADNELTGGLGADEMHGGEGTDRLRAQDGIKDRIIDCGDGTDYNAIKDGGGIDPPAISCP